MGEVTAKRYVFVNLLCTVDLSLWKVSRLVDLGDIEMADSVPAVRRLDSREGDDRQRTYMRRFSQHVSFLSHDDLRRAKFQANMINV